MLRTGFDPQLGIRGNREETKQKKKKIRRTTVVPNLLFAEANHRFGKPFLFFLFVFSSFFFLFVNAAKCIRANRLGVCAGAETSQPH